MRVLDEFTGDVNYRLDVSRETDPGSVSAIDPLVEIDGELAEIMELCKTLRAEVAIELGRHAKGMSKANRTALGIELVSTAAKKRYDNTRAASGIGAYLSEHRRSSATRSTGRRARWCPCPARSPFNGP